MNIKRQILEFIVDHQARWNTLPTQAEIRDAFGGLSDDVDLHLRQLDREGLIAVGLDDDGTVLLTPTFDGATRIGLRGTAAVNGSIMLNLHGIDISMPSNDMEAMQICDESMIDAGIEHGDIVILRNAAPERGDIVAVTIDGIDVLRRYLVVTGIPHLLAENPRRPDLRVAFDVTMHGVMWGLIRMGPCRHHRKPAREGSVYSQSIVREKQGFSASGREMRADQVSSPIARNRPLETGTRTPRRDSTKFVKRTVAKPENIVTPPNWPEVPSGIMLNDGEAGAYGSDEDVTQAKD